MEIYKVLVTLSCGHLIEMWAPSRPGVVDRLLEAKRNRLDITCHRGNDGAHESFVNMVLTSAVDRVWIQEG